MGKYLRVPLDLDGGMREVLRERGERTYTMGFPSVEGALFLFFGSNSADIIAMPSQSKVVRHWVDKKIEEL